MVGFSRELDAKPSTRTVAVFACRWLLRIPLVSELRGTEIPGLVYGARAQIPNVRVLINDKLTSSHDGQVLDRLSRV
jgi:hypothetical protein